MALENSIYPTGVPVMLVRLIAHDFTHQKETSRVKRVKPISINFLPSKQTFLIFLWQKPDDFNRHREMSGLE